MAKKKIVKNISSQEMILFYNRQCNTVKKKNQALKPWRYVGKNSKNVYLRQGNNKKPKVIRKQGLF